MWSSSPADAVTSFREGSIPLMPDSHRVRYHRDGLVSPRRSRVEWFRALPRLHGSRAALTRLYVEVPS